MTPKHSAQGLRTRRQFLRTSLATTTLTALPPLVVSVPASQSQPGSPDTRGRMPAASTPVLPRAEIKLIDGQTELVVDGRVRSRMWGRLSCPGGYALEKLAQYRGAGIEVFLTDVDMDCTLGWDGEDRYDYAPYEWHVQRIVEAQPDILLVLYVGCAGCAPYLWNRAHEDQLPLLSNGDRLRIPSLASQLWLRDSSEALRRFVRHFQRSPYGRNIIGFNLIQWSNEWHTPTSRLHSPLDDYSAPMLASFRVWLRKHYRDDERALRLAWQDREVTFETATIPEEKRRLAGGGLLRGLGGRDARVLDYQRCYDETKTEFIIGQCRAVKEASLTPVLTCLSRLGERAMLESPWVDCHHGPYHYKNRKLHHVSGYAFGTYRARGKLHVDQIDTGTHLLPKTGGQALGVNGIWPGPFRLTENTWESLEILERDVAYSVALNGTLYWNEGGPGWMFPILSHGVTTWGRCWYDLPEINRLIIRWKQLLDENRTAGARSAAQVAVVHSDHAATYLAVDAPFEQLVSRQSTTMSMIAFSGVPYDAYSLEDFDHIDRSYVLYIFLNAVFVPASQRAAIRRKLAAEPATAVWIYGAGYADERVADVAQCAELTGLRLRMEETPGPVQVKFAESAHPLLRDLDGISAFGTQRIEETNNSYRPLPDQRYVAPTQSVPLPALFWCDDPGVTVLGTLEGSGRPGFVVREDGAFRSIWLAAPQPPWQLLRNIAAYAGVHVYSRDGDQLMANDRFVALYCLSSGEKLIRLPAPRDVLDATEGRLIASATREIRFHARAMETRSFVLRA